MNRLPDEEVTLESGVKVKPQTFPPGQSGVSLHGGPDAWDQRVRTSSAFATSRAC